MQDLNKIKYLQKEVEESDEVINALISFIKVSAQDTFFGYLKRKKIVQNYQEFDKLISTLDKDKLKIIFEIN